MGCIFSATAGTPLHVSVQVDVAVPADALWEVVTDIDHHAEIVETVVGIKRIYGDKFQVGTRWKEIRKFQNRELSLIKTIVRIDKEPLSWSFHVSYPSSRGGYQDQVTTTTFTITPIDEQHSVLIGSFTYMTGTPIVNACCLQRLKRFAEDIFTKEMEDYGRAAVKRQTEKESKRI
jgi:hypothetical protein